MEIPLQENNFRAMKKQNLPLLLALMLTSLAFLAHTFGGDMELLVIQPKKGIDNWDEMQQIWTMARSGWHWISIDLLFASIILALVSFTKTFKHPKTVLNLLTIYFLSYAIVWFLVILISPTFPNNFLKLGQWLLLLTISGLIYLGTKKYEV